MHRFLLLLTSILSCGFVQLRAGDNNDAPPLRFSQGYAVPIHVHTDGYGGIPYNQLRAALERAMGTWHVPSSTFQFIRDPNGEDGDTPAVDGVNIVRFETEQLPREVDPNSVLAFTSPVSVACTGIILEADITFNAVTSRWSTDDVSRLADIETVALHELGHMLGLDHTNIREAVMFPSIVQRVRRTLHPDDLAGIQANYAPAIGGECSHNGGCNHGEVCQYSVLSDDTYGTLCGAPLGNRRPGQPCDPDRGPCSNGCANGICLNNGTCSAICRGDQDCPGDLTCLPQDVGNGQRISFCLDLTLCEDDLDSCPDGEACVITAHPTENRALRICTNAGPIASGRPCRTADQCAGALCQAGTCTELCDSERDCPDRFSCDVQNVSLGGGVRADVGACSVPNDPCARQRDCDDGFGCAYVLTEDEVASLCVLTDGSPAGAQCQDDAECRSSMCLGDKCSDVCRNDGDCPLDMECGRVRVGNHRVGGCMPLPPPPPDAASFPDAARPDTALPEDAGLPDAAQPDMQNEPTDSQIVDQAIQTPDQGHPTDAVPSDGEPSRVIVHRVGSDDGCQGSPAPAPTWLLFTILFALRRRRLQAR